MEAALTASEDGKQPPSSSLEADQIASALQKLQAALQSALPLLLDHERDVLGGHDDDDDDDGTNRFRLVVAGTLSDGSFGTGALAARPGDRGGGHPPRIACPGGGPL